MKSSQCIIESLKRAGVQSVFGVGGANVEDLYDAVITHGEGMKALVAKHEFAAATMADAYSRVSGRLGVVMATSGGGAFNLVAGLAESRASSVPVLALIGQTPSSLEGLGGFQDSSGKFGSIDAEKVFSAVAKSCFRITDAASVPELIEQAIASALSHPQGPVVLLIAKDVQCAQVPGLAPAIEPGHEEHASDAAVQAAANDLADSVPRGVVLICGEGVTRVGAQTETARLAELLDARVAVTAGAKNAFDNFNPRYIGVTGVMGHTSVVDHLARADRVVLVGTRMSSMNRFGVERALKVTRTLVLGALEPFPGVSEGLHVKGALRSTLERLNSSLSDLRAVREGASAPDLDDGVRFLDSRPSVGQQLPSLDQWMSELQAQIEPGSNVIFDAGNAIAAAVHRLRLTSDSQYCLALGMGGMGYSFGAAIGAALANGRKTYVFAGDGAYFMHGHEIHTAVELGLPITYLVFDNSAHAMCVTREALYFKADYSFNRFKRSDLAGGVGKMFLGVPSFEASRPGELSSALAAVRAEKGPSFVSVQTSADELPPFSPFLDQLKKLEKL